MCKRVCWDTFSKNKNELQCQTHFSRWFIPSSKRGLNKYLGSIIVWQKAELSAMTWVNKAPRNISTEKWWMVFTRNSTYSWPITSASTLVLLCQHTHENKGAPFIFSDPQCWSWRILTCHLPSPVKGPCLFTFSCILFHFWVCIWVSRQTDICVYM